MNLILYLYLIRIQYFKVLKIGLLKFDNILTMFKFKSLICSIKSANKRMMLRLVQI